MHTKKHFIPIIPELMRRLFDEIDLISKDFHREQLSAFLDLFVTLPELTKKDASILLFLKQLDSLHLVPIFYLYIYDSGRLVTDLNSDKYRSIIIDGSTSNLTEQLVNLEEGIIPDHLSIYLIEPLLTSESIPLSSKIINFYLEKLMKTSNFEKIKMFLTFYPQHYPCIDLQLLIDIILHFEDIEDFQAIIFETLSKTIRTKSLSVVNLIDCILKFSETTCFKFIAQQINLMDKNSTEWLSELVSDSRFLDKLTSKKSDLRQLILANKEKFPKELAPPLLEILLYSHIIRSENDKTLRCSLFLASLLDISVISEATLFTKLIRSNYEFIAKLYCDKKISHFYSLVCSMSVNIEKFYPGTLPSWWSFHAKKVHMESQTLSIILDEPKGVPDDILESKLALQRTPIDSDCINHFLVKYSKYPSSLRILRNHLERLQQHDKLDQAYLYLVSSIAISSHQLDEIILYSKKSKSFENFKSWIFQLKEKKLNFSKHELNIFSEIILNTNPEIISVFLTNIAQANLHTKLDPNLMFALFCKSNLKNEKITSYCYNNLILLSPENQSKAFLDPLFIFDENPVSIHKISQKSPFHFQVFVESIKKYTPLPPPELLLSLKPYLDQMLETFISPSSQEFDPVLKSFIILYLKLFNKELGGDQKLAKFLASRLESFPNDINEIQKYFAWNYREIELLSLITYLSNRANIKTKTVDTEYQLFLLEALPHMLERASTLEETICIHKLVNKTPFISKLPGYDHINYLLIKNLMLQDISCIYIKTIADMIPSSLSKKDRISLEAELFKLELTRVKKIYPIFKSLLKLDKTILIRVLLNSTKKQIESIEISKLPEHFIKEIEQFYESLAIFNIKPDELPPLVINELIQIFSLLMKDPEFIIPVREISEKISDKLLVNKLLIGWFKEFPNKLISPHAAHQLTKFTQLISNTEIKTIEPKKIAEILALIEEEIPTLLKNPIDSWNNSTSLYLFSLNTLLAYEKFSTRRFPDLFLKSLIKLLLIDHTYPNMIPVTIHFIVSRQFELLDSRRLKDLLEKGNKSLGIKFISDYLIRLISIKDEVEEPFALEPNFVNYLLSFDDEILLKDVILTFCNKFLKIYPDANFILNIALQTGIKHCSTSPSNRDLIELILENIPKINKCSPIISFRALLCLMNRPEEDIDEELIIFCTTSLCRYLKDSPTEILANLPEAISILKKFHSSVLNPTQLLNFQKKILFNFKSLVITEKKIFQTTPIEILIELISPLMTLNFEAEKIENRIFYFELIKNIIWGKKYFSTREFPTSLSQFLNSIAPSYISLSRLLFNSPEDLFKTHNLFVGHFVLTGILMCSLIDDSNQAHLADEITTRITKSPNISMLELSIVILHHYLYVERYNKCAPRIFLILDFLKNLPLKSLEEFFKYIKLGNEPLMFFWNLNADLLFHIPNSPPLFFKKLYISTIEFGAELVDIIYKSDSPIAKKTESILHILQNINITYVTRSQTPKFFKSLEQLIKNELKTTPQNLQFLNELFELFSFLEPDFLTNFKHIIDSCRKSPALEELLNTYKIKK